LLLNNFYVRLRSLTLQGSKIMNNIIEILDAPMGSGKTTGIINWMKSNISEKFLYVSPLLSEVEDRIPSECAQMNFAYPNTLNHKRKSDHLLDLLKQGRNIAMTHSLYKSLRDSHLNVIKSQNYILVVDEEISFISAYKTSDYKNDSDDLMFLKAHGIVDVDTNNQGKVSWISQSSEHQGRYEDIKNMCDLDMLYCSKRDMSMVVLHLPIKLIRCAKRVIVVTYLFEGSIMQKFMELKGINCIKMKNIKLLKTDEEVRLYARNKIEFVTSKKVQECQNFSLSVSWWSEKSNKSERSLVSNAIRSIGRNTKVTKHDYMYCYPKAFNERQGKSLRFSVTDFPASSCFVSCNTRATNMYSHKKVLFHAYNRYPPVAILAYLQDYGFTVSADMFALSELIQWVFRSDIRNGGGIKLCILSERMKRLMDIWLNGDESTLL
jgi:hypothetical protein